jgi:putative salt-induced outer membrane protein YdiY
MFASFCRVCWLAVFLCLGPISGKIAAGQVNTERMRALDVDGVRFEVGGDVAVQSGNADLFEVGMSLRIDVRSQANYLFLVGDLRYGEKDGDPFRNRSFAHLRYNRTLTPWLVAEGFTQVERDGFAQLQLRTLGGAGLRVQYVNTDAFKLFQGTTPMYEFENLDASAVTVHPATSSHIRWSNYVNVRLQLTDNTYLLNTIYVQPRADALGDTRILDDARLAVALSKRVTLNIRFNLRYDSRPPDEVEDLDLALRNGITVAL